MHGDMQCHVPKEVFVRYYVAGCLHIIEGSLTCTRLFRGFPLCTLFSLIAVAMSSAPGTRGVGVSLKRPASYDKHISSISFCNAKCSRACVLLNMIPPNVHASELTFCAIVVLMIIVMNLLGWRHQKICFWPKRFRGGARTHH